MGATKTEHFTDKQNQIAKWSTKRTTEGVEK